MMMMMMMLGFVYIFVLRKVVSKMRRSKAPGERYERNYNNYIVEEIFVGNDSTFLTSSMNSSTIYTADEVKNEVAENYLYSKFN